jgi:hypothetical protein
MLTKYPLLALAILIPAVAAAQHGAGGTGPALRSAPPEAAQFDFLIGQWELSATPRATSLAARIHGVPKLSGTWKAWRALDGWGIEDEMKLIDGSGNPRVFVHTVRVYSASAKRWNGNTLDVRGASFTAASAEWRNGQMLVSASGTDPDGRPFLSRTRFHDITRDAFRVRQDRSYDNGKSWTEGVLRIEARRVSATAAR